jgi:hypothetical protein
LPVQGGIDADTTPSAAVWQHGFRGGGRTAGASAVPDGNTDHEVAMRGHDIHATADVHPDAIGSIERIYELWDAALGVNDVEAAAALYAEDTRLESPLVHHLLGSEI